MDFLRRRAAKRPKNSRDGSDDSTPRWSMGVLNDKDTIEVPGSVLLLASNRNEPLGLHHAPARISHSSLATGYASRATSPRRRSTSQAPEPAVKKTDNGEIILDPQPEDSANDPLNWPTWRRDTALLSLGFYCMIGGGISPILAAGFPDVSADYDVEVETVALTTGLFMMGLGLGAVVASPTAILFGKRPVYLVSAVVFILTSIWCALSPNFPSLVVARIFQGISVSPVECLPSATIAEIFFLHERAFRIGIYTLLLLGGKNLVPLVSAFVIQGLSWRWAFWIVSFVVAFGGVMLFLFVPETFWDRAPSPKPRERPNLIRRLSSRYGDHHEPILPPPPTLAQTAEKRDPSATAATGPSLISETSERGSDPDRRADDRGQPGPGSPRVDFVPADKEAVRSKDGDGQVSQTNATSAAPERARTSTSELEEPEKRGIVQRELDANDVLTRDEPHKEATCSRTTAGAGTEAGSAPQHATAADPEKGAMGGIDSSGDTNYTAALRQRPARTFAQQLRPYNGRLNSDSWFRAMLRPFVLFSYPAILWSAAVYSCSVGWLIVISEALAIIYQESARGGYNFTPLQTGLVYISPFVGGLFGTAVAGKVSDVVVKAMARRNGGLYEPEFRLVMGIPILLATVIGLMGFGWSAEEHDHWIVPTVFFGIISFGCSLGSTTSITFCVDSYRQYAGEALVTLNFSKNIFHGLVFSVFFTHWMAEDGTKTVFIWTGVIQLILMLTTIPLFIYGKRLRMWTVRKNLVEKLIKP